MQGLIVGILIKRLLPVLIAAAGGFVANDYVEYYNAFCQVVV